MRFIDDVDLGSGIRGREAGPFPQRPDIVDPAVRGGVDFNKVQRPTGVHGLTGSTFAARLAIDGSLTVESSVQDASEARLPGAPGSTEQVSVGDGSAFDRIFERASNCFLADHIGEGPRPPTEVQRPAIMWELVGQLGQARYPADVSATR